jgi:GcrA cell cycle regulator
MNQHTAAWPSERDAEVIRLRDSGLSYEEIGAAIGTTRNAVSGRLRRLGHAAPRTFLTPEERRHRHRECDRAYKAKKAGGAYQRRAFIISELLSVEPRHVSLVDLQSGDCHWPYGDGPFTFCGCAAVEAKPYCPQHMQQGTEPARARVRA